VTYPEFWRPLTALYGEGEAKAIARLVMEEHFGLSMADVLCGRMGDEAELRQIQQRLLTGEPVQYVLGRAEFGGRWFHVAPGVLIPRPETYELCQWCLPSDPSGWRGNIIDIGTGSGCIACTLAAELPHAKVAAWDISETALAIARDNARRLHVNVTFSQIDILQLSMINCQLSIYDIIISNPPYICQRERTAMERNVLDYEPSLALFVPDDDPLLFYRAIADYARQALKPGGALYFEINPLYAAELQSLLSKMAYHAVELREDQYGKPRMMKAIRP
jgi:release factor glutamine methyltransferase